MLEKILKETLYKVDSEYALFVKGLSTGECFYINKGTRVSSASIIKLFIMGAAFQSMQEDRFTLHQRISVKEEERIPYSIIALLEPEHSYSIQDLITLMIIQSDNTATNVLISLLGMEYIQCFISAQGMKNTIIARKMLDYAAKEEGRDNITTVEDVSTYLLSLYEKKVINSSCSEQMLYILSKQLDDSLMKRELSEEVHIAHKTGGLPYLKHDAGIVYTKEEDYIFVMFTWNGKEDAGGKKIIGDASKLVYEYFTDKSLQNRGSR